MSDVAVVTGGAGGIGKAVCASLAHSGWRVLSIDVVPSPIRANVESFVGDVTNPNLWDAVQKHLVSENLKVTSLLHFAFHLERENFPNFAPNAWIRHFDVNIASVQTAIAKLGWESFAQDNASMILASSVHSRIGVSLHSGYAASKAALNALARQLAGELAGRIRVNSLVLGPINSPVWAGASAAQLDSARNETASLRMGEPEDVANLVRFLVSREASFINGSELVLDGGFLAKKETR